MIRMAWLLVVGTLYLAAVSCHARADSQEKNAPPKATTPADPDEYTLYKLGLPTDTKALRAFLKRCGDQDVKLRQLDRLIRLLGSGAFAERERASADLIALGWGAIPTLEQAAKNPDPEISRRAKECTKAILGKSPKEPPELKGYARIAALRLLLRRERPADLTQIYLAAILSPDVEGVVQDAYRMLREALGPLPAYSIGYPAKPKELQNLRPGVAAIIDALMDASRSPNDDLRRAALGSLGSSWSQLPAKCQEVKQAAGLEARLAAIRELSTYVFFAKQAAPTLIEALKDKDPKVRTAAAQGLGRMVLAVKLVVPALVSAMDDAVPEVRQQAVYSLGRIGPEAEAALPALVKKLKHGEAALRGTCAYALGQIGRGQPVRVLPALLEAFKDPEAARGAAFGVYFIGPPAKEALPFLLRLVKDYTVPAASPNERVTRQIAFWAIASIGPEATAAMPFLLKVAQDKSKKNQWRDAAVCALGQIGPAAEPAVPVLTELLKDKAFCWSAVQGLGNIGPAAKPAIPALMVLIKDQAIGFQQRYWVVEALEKIDPTMGSQARQMLVEEYRRITRGGTGTVSGTRP